MSKNTRAHLPFFKIIFLPYLSLFLLYFLIAAAGSFYLYYRAREAQGQLIINNLTENLSIIVEKLKNNDLLFLLKDQNSWLNKELKSVFTHYPELRSISIKSRQIGFSQSLKKGKIITRTVTPLPPKHIEKTFSEKNSLFQKKSPHLKISFILTDQNNKPIEVEFVFHRSSRQHLVSKSLNNLIKTIFYFLILGVIGLISAVFLTIWAARSIHKLEAKMQELYRQASLAELSAEFVHNLRNPLASFRANLQNLIITPEEIETIIQEMDEDLKRIEEKLSSFLKLTRMEQEPMTIVRAATLLKECVNKLQPLAQNKGLELTLKVDDDPKIKVHHQSFMDAIINVIVNALESGQRTGSIEISLSSLSEKKMAQIQISDKGKGIPDEYKDKIFQPFFTTKSKGHGLGLAIVKKIITQHNGTITIRSHKKEGSTFTIYIPIAAD
jgi:signal transduction histidine kinase